MSTYPSIVVNGVPMDDPAQRWGIDPEQPLRGLPGRRNTSVTVPGRAGVLRPPVDAFDVATFPVSLVVFGSGSTSDAYVASRDANLGHLGFLFSQPEVIVDYYASATQIYRASCRLSSATTPSAINSDAAKVTYALEIPEGFWRSPASAVYTAASPISGVTFTIDTLSGSTAPITDAQIMLGGPFTSASLTDMYTGQQLNYPAAVTAGQFLRIDCKAYTATLLGAADFAGAGPDKSPLVRTAGVGSEWSWLNLTPSATFGADPSARAVRLRCIMTGSTSASSMKVNARKAY